MGKVYFDMAISKHSYTDTVQHLSGVWQLSTRGQSQRWVRKAYHGVTVVLLCTYFDWMQIALVFPPADAAAATAAHHPKTGVTDRRSM